MKFPQHFARIDELGFVLALLAPISLLFVLPLAAELAGARMTVGTPAAMQDVHLNAHVTGRAAEAAHRYAQYPRV